MPVFEIEMNGETYEVDAPNQELAILSLKSSMPTADEQKAAPTGNFGEGVMDAARGLGSLFTTNPFTTVKNAVNAQVGEGKKALEAGSRFAKSGDWKDASETVGHGFATALPLLGPAAAGAGEDLGSEDPRRVGRGVTNGLLAAAPIGLKNAPKAVGAVARATPDAAVDLASAAYGFHEGGPIGGMFGLMAGHGPIRAAVQGARKWGLKGEEGAKTPTTPVAPRTTAEGAKVAPSTPKPPTANPKSSGRDYTQTPAEEIAQRQFEENLAARGVGPDDPLPSDMTNGAPESPSMSTRMDMEPDFLHQDVVRYPRPKGILRSDESVQGLVNEMSPGARVKGLKKYPRPSGNSETARALRQRANIAEGTSSPKPVSAKGKKK